MKNKIMVLVVFLGLSSLCGNVFASQAYQQLHNIWELQQVYAPGTDHKKNLEQYKADYAIHSRKKAFLIADLSTRIISNILQIADNHNFKSQFILDSQYCVVSTHTLQELQELLNSGAMLVATKTEVHPYGSHTTVLPTIITHAAFDHNKQ